MAEQNKKHSQAFELGYEDRFTVATNRFFTWIQKDFRQKHKNTALVVLGLLVFALVGWNVTASDRAQQDAVVREKLGVALHYHYLGKADSARGILSEILSGDEASGMTRSKAALLFGNLLYGEGDYVQAAQNYRAALDNAGSSLLLESGARHGLATVHMQEKSWDAAATSLESFVKDYSATSVALVPDALWKLALVYRETGKTELARKTCDRILSSYGDSRQASSAKKLLASLKS